MTNPALKMTNQARDITHGQADDEGLPVGWYTLPDGRRFYGMNDFELRAASREAWRLQQIADVRLAIRLDAQRPQQPEAPRPGRRVSQAGEQLAWAI